MNALPTYTPQQRREIRKNLELIDQLHADEYKCRQEISGLEMSAARVSCPCCKGGYLETARLLAKDYLEPAVQKRKAAEEWLETHASALVAKIRQIDELITRRSPGPIKVSIGILSAQVIGSSNDLFAAMFSEVTTGKRMRRKVPATPRAQTLANRERRLRNYRRRLLYC